MSVDLNALYDDRANPETRMVLEDYERSLGRMPTRLACALSYISADAAAGADAVDRDAAADVVAVADADDAADAAADAAGAAADADADAAADADADAAAAAAAIQSTLLKQFGDQDMRDGLKVIMMPGNYYGYGVTKVGWIRRVNGDEYEILPGAVTVLRTGNAGNVEDLAADGLTKRYKIHGTPSRTTEPFHRFGPRRIIDANEEAHRDHCPRPKGWEETR